MADLFNRLDFYLSLVIIGVVVFLWTRRLWRRVMSRWAPPVLIVPVRQELAFPSQEQPLEQPGTAPPKLIPAPVEHIGALVELLTLSDDDTLLRALAQVENAGGDYRWADSRIAKFIGGRTENRVDQVQAVRGTAPPPIPVRTYHVTGDGPPRDIPVETARSA